MNTFSFRGAAVCCAVLALLLPAIEVHGGTTTTRPMYTTVHAPQSSTPTAGPVTAETETPTPGGTTTVTPTTVITSCSQLTCQNGGWCYNNGNNFICNCLYGYTGSTCEIINACSSSPCLFGGRCYVRGNGYVCNCAPGFAGTNCGIGTACIYSANYCANGGTCVSYGYNYCYCLSGYTGSKCEINTNTCTNSMCQNGGTCFNIGRTQRCRCQYGYTGATCETVITSCNQMTCQNGATCYDDEGYYAWCSCQYGYIGPSCESLPAPGLLKSTLRSELAPSSPHLELKFNGTLVLAPLADGRDSSLGNATLACMNSYVSEFKSSFHDVTGRVNSDITAGKLCAATPILKFYAGDIIMLGAGSCDGNQIAVQFTSWLSTDRTDSMQLMEYCAKSIVSYIQNSTNWRQPTIGGVFNCASAAFNPPHFDNPGVKYICSEAEA